MESSHDPRMKPYPSFEEWFNRDYPIQEVDGLGFEGALQNMMNAWRPIIQTHSNKAWNARDQQVNELLEALKAISEAFEARMGDWENAEFHDCYNKAMIVITRSIHATNK